MASAEALAMISLGSGDYAPGEIIHGLSEADLDDLKGFVRELTPGEAIAVPEGVVLAVEGDMPEIVDPVVEVPGVDSGKIVEGDPLLRDALAEAEDSDEGEGDEEKAEDGPQDRIAEVEAAIDLLEEADFTATGRPKIAALTSVLGYKPEADEVTAALALREAKGQ